MREDRAGMILNAIAKAVMDMMGGLINKENLIERLEQNRSESGNVMEKMVYKEAAELVRRSAGKFLQ